MNYEKPAVTDHGKLTDLTAGQTDGERLDRNFPVGTLKRDLTFS
jgi:hypothetical protein